MSYSSEIIPNVPPMIEVYFQNSGVFTTIIEFASKISTNIPFLFTSEGLTIEFGSNHSQYSQGSYGNCASNHCFKLDGVVMKNYSYRNNYNSSTVLGFNCETLLKVIKSKKKFPFRFYYYEGSTKVYIGKDSVSEDYTNSCKTSIIEHISVNYVHYQSLSYNLPTNKFRISAVSLTELFTECSKNNTFNFYISGNNTYLDFTGYKSDNTKSYYSRHELEEELTTQKVEKPKIKFDPAVLALLSPDGEEIVPVSPNNVVPTIVNPLETVVYYRLPKDLLTAFTKINKISNDDAMITFYYASNMALQIKTPIGIFGQYTGNIYSN